LNKYKYFLLLQLPLFINAVSENDSDYGLLLIFLFIFCLVIFILGIFFGIKLGKNLGRKISEDEFKQQIPEIREDAILRSRSVLTGQFSEQLAPYFPNFPFNPTEMRFIGKPIDFIVFKGLDEKEITEIIFVEVKSGKSRLNQNEKSLKTAIINKKIRWEEYRIPDEITRKI